MGSYDGKTALIVTDVQHDFADPDGSLYVRGGEEVVPFINGEIDRAARAGGVIVYTQDWHPESTPHFAKDGGVWPVHCVRDSWGAQLLPALRIEGEILRKGTGGEDGYSAFTVRDPQSGEQAGTRLEQLLLERGVERVVVVGLATDYCVKDTALDAIARGFHTTVLQGGVRGVNLEPGDDERALQQVQEAGGRLE